MTQRSSGFRSTKARHAAHVVFALGALVAFGGAGCTCNKKPKTEEAKKDEKPAKKATVSDVPAPADLLIELDMKDPDALAKRAADGAGFGKEVGSSPYEKLLGEAKDENAKKALKAIDPHGALVVVALGDVGAAIKAEKFDGNFHAIGAARLKDAEAASTALAAASKAGKFKTQESKALETTLYTDPAGKKGVLVVYGDQILASDSVESLESAGKYVASRAARVEKQEHDFEGRIVVEKLSKPSVKWLETQWAKVKTEIPGKAQTEADSVVSGLLAGFGDTGDIAFEADVKGDDILFHQKVAAKGTLAKWLGKYPTIDPKGLLSMPKGQGAALIAFPEGLGPLTYEGLEEGLKSGKVPAADAADISKNVRAFGAALGHEVAYTSFTHGATPSHGFSTPDTEIFARIELTDAAAAKTSLTGLGTVAKKPATGLKLKTAAYKKGGGEGETWTLEEGTKTSTFVYAIKDKYLYLDVCVNCVPTMFDGALEGKDTLEGDSSAKAKIASYPTKGVISATYGDAASYGTLLSTIIGSGAGPTPSGSTWGYAVASGDGVEGKSGMPLSVLGGIVKAIMMGGGMGGRHGGGLGLAPPPPGMDE
jgi:hypothetical protein